MSGTVGAAHARALRQGRAQILGADPSMSPAVRVRTALRELYKRELGLMARESGIVEGSGFALVALGGLGRGEVLQLSELDLLLVH